MSAAFSFSMEQKKRQTFSLTFFFGFIRSSSKSDYKLGCGVVRK